MLIHAPAVRPDALLSLRARSGVTESSALSTLASREFATPSARDSSRPLMPRRTTYSRLRTSPGCRGRRMVPRLDGVDRGGRRIVYLHSRPPGEGRPARRGAAHPPARWLLPLPHLDIVVGLVHAPSLDRPAAWLPLQRR